MFLEWLFQSPAFTFMMDSFCYQKGIHALRKENVNRNSDQLGW